MILLVSIGVIFIHSVQSYSGQVVWYQSSWVKQFIFIIIGSLFYIGVSMINYKYFLKYAHFFYFGSILLLLALWTPLGIERFGARRWLNFQFILFQPSEAAKIGILMMTASLLARSQVEHYRESIRMLLKITPAIFFPILLILIQPDLGSSLVIPPMIFSLLYISKLFMRFFRIVFVIFMVLIGILAIDLYRYYHTFTSMELSFQEDKGKYEDISWLPLHDYQRNRILDLIIPEAIDPLGTGVTWNRKQSLISVGSGGLMGKGYGRGTQAKLGYLPQSVAHNDFIFSVIAEETGFLGALLVISIFGTLIYNNLRIAGVSRDRFGLFLIIGINTLLMMHIFVNIGMTIGFMPITGLPLPFLSYGGSFIISCFILQGLVQSVYRYRRDFS